eukprot:SAG11_NODE_22438_length_406_cov_0.635179_1_plen_87_part_10
MQNGMAADYAIKRVQSDLTALQSAGQVEPVVLGQVSGSASGCEVTSADDVATVCHCDAEDEVESVVVGYEVESECSDITACHVCGAT